MPEAMPHRLSIVIVTYNSLRHIGACLDSILKEPPHVAHEIVVVDNASPDGTGAAIRAQWPGVRVIDAGANLGFARANNLGIRSTTGDLLLLLNPDTLVPAGAIDTLILALDQRPEVAVVGPRLVDEQGRGELSFGSMLSPWAELRQKTLVFGNERGIFPIAGYVQALTRRARTTDWVSGACLLVWRADAEAAGLLDERYFMYVEDVDFCAAIRARGRTVAFVPSVEVIHRRGLSRATAASATERAYRSSQMAFYEKHHPGWVGPLRAYLKIRGKLPDTSNTS
jgi:GT2 family glycosyltransferase